MVEIKNQFNGEIICEGRSKKSAAEKHKADLWGADLREANLWGANLWGADLREADLRGANLREADLREADLRGANLREADLRGANLRGADLREAKIEFYNFPNLSIFTQFILFNLTDELKLELMRRDAEAHPHPERFEKWAKGEDCPYQNEDRWFHFEVDRKLYKPGKPRMKTSDLILELCKCLGFKIRGYLE